MIIPVIIEKSAAEIKKRVAICSAFASMIQIDITEKDYVGTNTVSDMDLIEKFTHPLQIDLDLMVSDPFKYLTKKYNNVKKITYYVKNGDNARDFLIKAKKYGYLAGLSIGPETNLAAIYANADLVDFIQFYCVAPGNKGRPFDLTVIQKIKSFAQKYPSIKIQADGGINKETLLELRSAGVNDFIVGSAIFNSSNPKTMYIELSNMEKTQEINQINSILDFPGKEAITQVAILGGAAWTEKDEPYKQAYETSRLLALNGYKVVNGGGPGVMEASTKGAHAGGSNNVLAITYYPNKPKRHYEGREPKNNFDTEVKTLDYFDRTKVMLQTTQAHIVFKGSIGTLSEFGMTWISSWIHEPHNKPIILFGDFWREFIALIEKHMLIVKGEEKMMRICTTPEEVIEYLKSFD